MENIENSNNYATRYRDLVVWQKSMDLVIEAYKLIEKLPSIEKYSLCDQMRRSAISIPSNIAEGFERNSPKEFARFLSIANGSKSELMTQFELCKRLGYLDDIDAIVLMSDEVGKMLNTLIKKINTD